MFYVVKKNEAHDPEVTRGLDGFETRAEAERARSEEVRDACREESRDGCYSRRREAYYWNSLVVIES